MIEPMLFSDFVEYVKLTLGNQQVKVAGDLNMKVERVAVCGGAGISGIPAAQEKAGSRYGR